ncbi:metal ABC transporter solute-binding protein, Zn/Mn family [Corynebacterium aquatimens]|uniref:Zinc/manganese transport system substrate-binding protein n=1 Tax=Corynebacterium aquatimens TaxID=1190508 RepID=A0A931DY75_9CORY|nr:zinc ABC transporter substrate-binding protein [Corynebacterium aquatimens]MBG6122300.1 zinc/manganese transport system substrate-binding protein [Corynebacterium aquatimens]WJY65158.1 high-affinity zinc transporter periplasmic component [Corynebacterium aquatimens]
MALRRLHRAFTLTAATALASASLIACSTNGTEGGASGYSGKNADPTNIIATTEVWADVASAVTGNEVPAIIRGASIDPHHFEPAAADLARIKEAGTVVANGGHYDSSLYTVAEQDRIIHAVPLDHPLGGQENKPEGHAHDENQHEGQEHEHEHGDSHAHGEGHAHGITEIPTSLDELEHIWLAPGKVKEVADAVAKRAGGDASTVDKRMDAITEKLNSFPHVHLAMTEPIAAPLIWGTQLHDLTPEKYLLATLNENEPSASDVAEFLALIESGNLDFLVVNPQSTNNATERLADAAKKKNIPIVEIRETPPEGVNFLDYFEQIVNDIDAIIAKANPRPDAELMRFQ